MESRGLCRESPPNLHSIHSIVEYMKHLMYLTTDARRVIFHSRTKLPLKKSYSSPAFKNKPLKVHPGLLMAYQTGVQSSLKDYNKIRTQKQTYIVQHSIKNEQKCKDAEKFYL